jgi:hypothetical protein
MATDEIRRAQCLNYPEAVGLRLCPPLNLGVPRPGPVRHCRPLRVPRVLRFHFPCGRPVNFQGLSDCDLSSELLPA